MALPGGLGDDSGGADVGSSDGATTPPIYQWAIDDPTSLGPCDAYIPANADVLPDGEEYLGRAYVDPAAGFVVVVTPDGAVTRVQPGPDGEYLYDFGGGAMSLLYPTQYPVVSDFHTSGGGGGIWVDSNPTGWGWTLEPLAPTPVGVNATSLHKTFAMVFGLVGQGYDPNAVPAGASAAVVLTYADGREISGTLVKDHPAPGPDEIDYEGLEAAALRVTLADGTAWEIRATYDPADIPVLPCQPLPPSGGVTAAEEQPAAPAAPAAPSAPAAPALPLSGPESSVFACAAPLPVELRDTADVQARSASGEVAFDEYTLFDVGTDGLWVEGVRPVWSVPSEALDNVHVAPGWSASGAGTDGSTMVGVVHFVEPVAIRDGVIVGAAGEPTEDWTAGGVGGIESTWFGTDADAGTEGFKAAFSGAHGLLVPCEGETGDLADAELALLYGFGPDIDHITYGWTPVVSG
jgi:hypothetical protein